MKRSISLAAVLCAVLFLPMARGRAQELYVGFNAANVTTNFTSGTNRFNNTYVGYTTNATNNLLNVSGAGTVLTNTNALIVGFDGRGNSLVISNGGKVANVEGSIGYTGFSSNNSALVTGAGSVWTNSANLYVGESGRSNSLVVANGGEVFVATNLFISAQAGASNNSVTVEGGRLVVTNNGQINIGVAGSGALNVTGGTVEVKTLIATNGANSVLNFNGGTIVSRGTTISNATDFYVGDTGSGATFIANGGGHNFASNMVVGNSGSGNSLIISNGATMTNFRAWIGYNLGSSNNSVLVTGTNSLTGSNSLWTNRSSLRLGSSGSGNSLVISNGGRAFFTLGLISFFAESSNNTVQVTGTNSIMTSGNAFYFGYYGSASSLLVSNGGTLAGTEGYLGLTATASNNSALITGANSLWTNSGQLWVGYEGISNSLTVSAGGTVVATNIVLGLQAGSSGTLNIGRFGTNDTAGTIAAPSIAFGTGTGAINFNQSNAVTITSAISGNGVVNQLGTGTTTLSASNTYTGDTTISAGTLRLSSENAVGGSRIIQTTLASLVEFLGGGRMTNEMTVFQYSFANSFEAAGQVTLADAASSIAVASGATVTGSGSFVGSGGLIKKGAGTLILGAANTYTGGTVINAGTVAISNGSSFGSNTVTFGSNGTTVAALASMQVTNNYALTGNGTMDVGANILTNSGVISGAGSLTKAGAGTMVLGAANTYTGGTTINAGTVAISNGSAFGLNTVTFASNDTTVAALASMQVTNNYALTGNGTMDVGANILTNSGVISGAGSLTKAGAGTMVLGAANTYTGGTTINAGTVAISNGSAFGSYSFGSYRVTFASNGATVAALASVQVNNNWSLIGNGTMDVGANIILTNSGEIEGGPGRLTKSGAGTLILTAENYARTMTINEGTLQIGNGGTTGSLNWSNFPSMVNNASLIFNRSGSLTQMIAISGPGSLTKAGAGTLILSGTNTYTGGTTVNGGTLGLSGANTLADAGTVTVTGAGSVLTNNFSSQFNVGNSGSGGQLVVSNGGTVRTLGAVIGRNSTASNNKATVTGSNSLWINYYNLYVGNSGSGNSLVISNGGTVSDEGTAGQFFIGANGSSSNNSVLVTGAGSLWTNRSELYVGSSGSGNSLVISNGGTVAVSSSYIGSSSINNSVLVSGAGSLWTNSSTLSVGRGNTNNALTVSDGGTLAASAISIAANAGSSGTLNIGRLGTNDAAGTITAPTIAFGSGTGVINFNQSNSTTLSAVISGNGTVNQLGTGTTTLSGANTYTRGTVVSAGSLVGTTTSLQGAITNNAAVTFDQSTAGTYSGAMSGSGSLTKTGIGRLSLSGSSSYNGATAVSAGDLNLSGGSITNSAVTVASGASLSGYGSVGTIGGAGAINPGNSPGILTTPQVNPSGGTDFNLEMTGTAPTYNNASNSVNDVIRITGATPFSQALAAGNGINIYFSGGALFTSVPKTITGGFFTDQSTNLASSISGATYNYYFANTNGPTTYNGASYYNKAQYESLVLGTNMSITVTTVAQTANFGSGDISGQVMQVQVIPEPSTYALLALAAAGWGAVAWRRRKQVS